MGQSSGLGHNIVRRESRVGERHHKSTQWRRGPVTRFIPEHGEVELL